MKPGFFFGQRVLKNTISFQYLCSQFHAAAFSFTLRPRDWIAKGALKCDFSHGVRHTVLQAVQFHVRCVFRVDPQTLCCPTRLSRVPCEGITCSSGGSRVRRTSSLPQGLRDALKPERVVCYKKRVDVHWQRLDPHLRSSRGLSDIMRLDFSPYSRCACSPSHQLQESRCICNTLGHALVVLLAVPW